MASRPLPRPDAVGSWTAELLAQGWCVLSDAVPPGLVQALDDDLRPAFDRTLFCKGDFYGHRTKRLGSLLARSEHADAFVRHPHVLDIVERVLAPWCDTVQLNLTQAIEIHPGAPRQFPHRDQDMWQGVKGEVEYLVNVMWPFTPFTAENGATIVYPDSHGASALTEGEPEGAFAAEMAPGSALLFLGSTLHGAGANRTPAIRRGMIVSYCLGWLKPYENQWLAYPPSVARHFPPELAALVGYRQHRPNLGNVEGQCPSVLLEDALPERWGAVDALRPDQAEMAAAFRRSVE
ncbi:phytanoyl-CoA dioxygenase family protein [Sphingomonas soli]|uniref:phytanoyl-CoA dioxygenase family protein n=1 Tax=Sphingomonas soli TaxID=266127 RepID=UPI000834F156|nr:phytanoyl-CoA dioxygenase family protein [Sphingomonas soli]